MIKGINTGNGLQVNNGYTTWPQFYNSMQNTGNSLIGSVRYNGSSQNLEVYDGNSWMIMSASYPTVELAPHVQAVVNWAQIKMAEEAKLKELAAKHPTVADAIEAMKRAEEQVRIVAALVDTE
jgi:hypothetical protein